MAEINKVISEVLDSLFYSEEPLREDEFTIRDYWDEANQRGETITYRMVAFRLERLEQLGKIKSRQVFHPERRRRVRVYRLA